jgi:hypothetical protein
VKIDLTFKGEFNNESPPVVMRPPKTPLLADIPQVFLYGCELCDWPLPTATRSTLRTASLLATGLFSTDYGVIALRKDSWNLYFVPSSLRSSFCCDFLAFCLRPLSLHFLFVFWISTLRFYLSVNVPSFSIMCFPMWIWILSLSSLTNLDGSSETCRATDQAPPPGRAYSTCRWSQVSAPPGVM